MNRLQWLVTLLAWLVVVAPGSARDVQLYVKNRPFEGTLRVLGSELFAPLDELLGALDCNWTYANPDLVKVVTVGRSHNSPPGPSITSVSSLLFDGRPVRVNQHLLSGRVYVDVNQFAWAIGSPYRLNTDSGTADLYAPLAASSREGTVHSNGDGRESPVVVTAQSQQITPDPDHAGRRLVRGYAVIRNGGNEAKQGVVLRLVLRDESGHELGRYAEVVGTLKAHADHTFQFPIFQDLHGQGPIRTELEIEHI